MRKPFATTLFVLATLLGPMAAHAEDSSTDTANQYLGDAAITTKVKAAFAEDKWVKGRAISVRTDHGVVDLTGSVISKDESNRATELATKVKSVVAVHNNLVIATP
jgi:hyperosmotically inducible protein